MQTEVCAPTEIVAQRFRPEETNVAGDGTGSLRPAEFCNKMSRRIGFGLCAVTDCGFGLAGGRGWTELAKEAPGFHKYLAPTPATLSSFTYMRKRGAQNAGRASLRWKTRPFVPDDCETRPKRLVAPERESSDLNLDHLEAGSHIL